MKKNKAFFLLISIIIIFSAAYSYALPSEVYLKTTGVNPGSSGVFHFGELGDINVLYGEYDLAIDWDQSGPQGYEAISGFCVEDSLSTSSNGINYYLMSPSDAGDDYIKAAYLLDQYLNGGAYSAQAYQIAIWEIVVGNDDNVTDSGDSFYAKFTNPFTTQAQSLVDMMASIDLSGFDYSSYRVVYNPHPYEPGTNYQDYIIKVKSVPDASLLWLLSPALIALGVAGRRRLA